MKECRHWWFDHTLGGTFKNIWTVLIHLDQGKIRIQISVWIEERSEKNRKGEDEYDENIIQSYQRSNKKA